MIGWYCNVGYKNGEALSISEITFLDINVPFTIPIIKQIPPESVLNEGILGADSTDDFYNIVDAYYGSDWYITYGALFFNSNRYDKPTIFDRILSDNFTAFLPGWDKSWPKTTEFFKEVAKLDNFRDYTYCIYIPKLKRAIVFRGYSGGIRKVNDDGTFSSPDIPSGSSGFTPYSMTVLEIPYSGNPQETAAVNNVPVLIVPYESKDTLVNYNNFRILKLKYDRNKIDDEKYVYNISGFSEDVGRQKYITSLFNDFSSPDFEGGEVPLPPPINPFEPGGASQPGDLPPGTFDDKSDPIPDSSLPTISAANTGFTRIYNPTLAQVQDLARYLWTDETVLQTIWNKVKQYFEDPMQAIIGFNLVPVPVPNGGTENFQLMYIPTDVQLTVAASQFVDVDCGTVKLERYYGSALDQSPYTKVSCYMPYIGTVQLDTDEVMGTELQVKYRVDIVTGSCVAKIFIDGSVLYQYSGHCAINIPISSSDFSSYVSAAISIAKLGIGAATGGAMGALASSQDADQQTNQVIRTTRTITDTERNPITGRQITTGTRTVTHTKEIPAESSSTRASYSYLSPANIANTVGQVMASKPNVEHAGSFSGNSGYLGIRRPFLIIERPNMCLPEQYQQLNGFPAMITMKLSDVKGFTKIQQIQLTGLSATNPEQAEIMGLLKSGVFF